MKLKQGNGGIITSPQDWTVFLHLEESKRKNVRCKKYQRGSICNKPKFSDILLLSLYAEQVEISFH